VPTKNSKGWSAKLAHIIEIKGGPRLVTLADARAFILKLPKQIEVAFFYQGKIPMRGSGSPDPAHPRL
jgi:hypothetical protein